ncbi:MAG: GNAT family N-acetyltransferase [Acidobacteria bacterium]|nr:GNAT family N-acetyltransferase [Acidobacteriota bacterium]
MQENSGPAPQNPFFDGKVVEANRTRSSVGERICLEPARSVEDVATVRELFSEYAQSLGFSLCFQSFDAELKNLPGDYAPPSGRLLLLTVDLAPAGCVALHRLAAELCEMKRLYVRPQFRAKGLGKLLAERVIDEARQIGYRKIRLDTVAPIMATAVSIYRNLGFQEIAPYRSNPIEGTLYLELAL